MPAPDCRGQRFAMFLSRLHVDGVRILRDVRLEPMAGLNVIEGRNGTGKTSLLEAVHLLSTGHSFRTRLLAPLLGEGMEAVQVSGTVEPGGDGTPFPVGIRKSARETEVHVRGRRVAGLADLARALPVQVIHPESHVLVSGPPAQRRSFLDWGAFHRSPDFHPVWLRYRRLLQQRNAAMRSGGDRRSLDAWDEALAKVGEELDGFRHGYLDVLGASLAALAREWPDAGGLSWDYRRGWPAGQGLTEALARSRGRDEAAGFTQAGPHRAEILWRLEGQPASEVASRGQQKSLVVLLKLAQARVLKDETGRVPVMLVDDLASELDAERRAQVLKLLRGLGGQVFVTVIEAEALDLADWPAVRMFHVEHGRFSVRGPS
jgi:DNA replication and repair protein RecF